jgi:hypothetical protein
MMAEMAAVVSVQHCYGTHDKVWDMTTITSLRKMEMGEEVEEKVEVNVGVDVLRSRRSRRRGGC